MYLSFRNKKAVEDATSYRPIQAPNALGLGRLGGLRKDAEHV